MSPIRVNADEFTEKHARRLKASTEDIRRGVARVTESPGVAAAEQIDKMRANLMAKFDDGTIERRLREVDLGDWKDKMLTKGVNNIAVGIDAAKDKVRKFAEKLIAYEGDLQTKVERMPSATLEDNIARATEWMRGMHNFKR